MVFQLYMLILSLSPCTTVVLLSESLAEMANFIITEWCCEVVHWPSETSRFRDNDFRRYRRQIGNFVLTN